jgi:predicted alpha/beta hydrolase family esterase
MTLYIDSFVAHSLGCLVVRAALLTTHLKAYRNSLHTFVSLCGPHLGISANESPLISSALWIYKRWNNSMALTQLQMLDSANANETALYRLSRSPGLDLFKTVLLFASEQDKYAPNHSALAIATASMDGSCIITFSTRTDWLID